MASSIIVALIATLSLTQMALAQPPDTSAGIDKDWYRQEETTLSTEFCEELRSRTLSGQCTSTTEASYGSARWPQLSLIGNSSSEIPVTGLPNPREISNIIFNQDQDNIFNARGINLLFVFFAQFIDHNLISTPLEESEPMDIEVPESDPILSSDESLPFSRSVRGEVKEGIERPLNTLSSALDLVAVYGPSNLRNIELRGFDSTEALAATLKTSGDDLLPLNENGFLNAPDTSDNFFLAGDHRPNEHLVLLSIHTLFLREHNRLVNFIRDRVGNVPPNLLYQAARAMNIAQFQKIVLEQFYPAATGRDLPAFNEFDPKANPTVSDIFGGAAYRVGHTMVSNTIPRRDSLLNELPSIPSLEVFFRPASEFSTQLMEEIFRGTANQRAQEIDAQVVNLLRNQLFTGIEGEEGFDLIAINLQRSRDHNLPSFNKIREIFGLQPARSFSDITSDVAVADRLSRAYRGQIDDVEAFVGFMAEDHEPGASLGRTMITVWEAEFSRIRDGDQFSYLIRDRFPSLVQRNFSDWVDRVYEPNGITLADIIVNNTEITREQLPVGNVFFETGAPVDPPTSPAQPSPSSSPTATPSTTVMVPTQDEPICIGRVCCAASCGSCGGAGCGRRPGGRSQCCVGAIRRSNIECSETVKSGCMIRRFASEPPICTNEVCCAGSCGRCGGRACSRLPGGRNRCCVSAIRRNGILCSSSVRDGCVLV